MGFFPRPVDGPKAGPALAIRANHPRFSQNGRHSDSIQWLQSSSSGYTIKTNYTLILSGYAAMPEL